MGYDKLKINDFFMDTIKMFRVNEKIIYFSLGV